MDNFLKTGKICYIFQVTGPENVANRKEVNEEKEEYKVSIFTIPEYEHF